MYDLLISHGRTVALSSYDCESDVICPNCQGDAVLSHDTLYCAECDYSEEM